MFAVISRSEPALAARLESAPPDRDRTDPGRAPGPRPRGTAGAAVIGFDAGPGGTRLRDLYQASPLRVCLPRPEPGELPTAVVVNTGGGVVGGDRLEVAVTVGAGAGAVVTTQAAEKVYRSAGADARIAGRLTVAPGAWLEWAPQETILFDGARLRRSLDIDVAPGGRLLAGETIVYGRAARGERFGRGLLADTWRLRRAGRLVWMDALRLERDIPAVLAAPAGFGGAAASATLVYAGDDSAAWIGRARERLEACRSRAGASLVRGLLLIRLLGRTAQELRADLAALWAGLRADLAGLPPRVPRLWQV